MNMSRRSRNRRLIQEAILQISSEIRGKFIKKQSEPVML